MCIFLNIYSVYMFVQGSYKRDHDLTSSCFDVFTLSLLLAAAAAAADDDDDDDDDDEIGRAHV